jgi:hypothetical protein
MKCQLKKLSLPKIQSHQADAMILSFKEAFIPTCFWDAESHSFILPHTKLFKQKNHQIIKAIKAIQAIQSSKPIRNDNPRNAGIVFNHYLLNLTR